MYVHLCTLVLVSKHNISFITSMSDILHTHRSLKNWKKTKILTPLLMFLTLSLMIGKFTFISIIPTQN